MKTIYDLRNDSFTIAQMQRASQESGPLGLRMTHGLIGTGEWWAHIQSGDLPLQSREGIVSHFWPGQNGDGPAEFELREADGHTSRWLCEIETATARQAFLLGRPVVVQYVHQERKTAFRGNCEAKVTVSIALG